MKVANEECCKVADATSTADVKAVGYITMELLQKYVKEDGAIGIDNINRWAPDSEPLEFLSMTTLPTSIDTLKKVSVF